MKETREFREIATVAAQSAAPPRSAGRTVRLVRAGFPARPGLDTAVSRALLLRADAGEVPETLRFHRPGPIVAFGRRDVLSPGYPAAVAAARARGFAAIERLAGGRAAVFHPDTVAFSWTIPDPAPRERIRHRFTALAGIVAAALRDLGADARVGEVPGEYCPGEFSVNVGGRVKVMGVGQRLARRAAHVGGVIVADGSDRVRAVLVPVYEALGVPWVPATAGAVADHAPGVTTDDVIAAVVARVGARHRLEPAALDAATVALAGSLQNDHVAPIGPGAPPG